MTDIRSDWTTEEIETLFNQPLVDLIFQAGSLHRKYHNHHKVQLSTLLSIKTGGCPEDCGYCSQSAHFDTPVEREKLLPTDTVLEAAKLAKDNGSTRFCMGAAWRQVREGEDFDRVLDMVRGVADMGLEVCVTLGMLTETQAKKLADAGLTAYNHNIDTSREFYNEVVHTRTFEDRIETIGNVRKAGIQVCSGGIIGLGETEADRVSFLHTLSSMTPHPESVPINALVPVSGTPMENNKPVDPFEFVRMIAVARILMPGSMVRLSAGRLELNDEAQALCFLAGANSIFTGETLLTTGNPGFEQDQALLKKLGLENLPPHSVEMTITETVESQSTIPG